MPVAYADSIIESTDLTTSDIVGISARLTDVEKATILWGFVILFWARVLIKKMFPLNIRLYNISLLLYIFYLFYRLILILDFSYVVSYIPLVGLLIVLLVTLKNIYESYWPSTPTGKSNFEMLSIDDISFIRFITLLAVAIIFCVDKVQQDAQQLKSEFLKGIEKYVRFDLVLGFSYGLFVILSAFYNLSVGGFLILFFIYCICSTFIYFNFAAMRKVFVTNQPYYKDHFNTIFLSVFSKKNVRYSDTAKRAPYYRYGSGLAEAVISRLPHIHVLTIAGIAGVGGVVYGGSLIYYGIKKQDLELLLLKIKAQRASERLAREIYETRGQVAITKKLELENDIVELNKKQAELQARKMELQARKMELDVARTEAQFQKETIEVDTAKLIKSQVEFDSRMKRDQALIKRTTFW